MTMVIMDQSIAEDDSPNKRFPSKFKPQALEYFRQVEAGTSEFVLRIEETGPQNPSLFPTTSQG
jgi:hypothetical protein